MTRFKLQGILIGTTKTLKEYISNIPGLYQINCIRKCQSLAEAIKYPCQLHALPTISMYEQGITYNYIGREKTPYPSCSKQPLKSRTQHR